MKHFLLEQKRQPVPVPGVEGVFVRKASARERLAAVAIENTPDRIARIVVCAACDAEGKALFTEGDVDALMDGPEAGQLDAILKTFLETNGILPAAATEREKNS